tara:strand:+ start:3616 stop:4002 length:387 start_codon:yes stop_codon:yes gene_type:complete
MFTFLKKIFFSTIIIALIGVFPFLSWGKEYVFELFCAFSISLINVIAGYYLVIKSINKSDVEFYKFVYGGMLIRMIVVFGFSIYIISNNFVLKTPYMLYLILFYVIHQWIEISGWLKELPNQEVQLKP